jgi:hypothetical protein
MLTGRSRINAESTINGSVQEFQARSSLVPAAIFFFAIDVQAERECHPVSGIAVRPDEDTWVPWQTEPLKKLHQQTDQAVPVPKWSYRQDALIRKRLRC